MWLMSANKTELKKKKKLKLRSSVRPCIFFSMHIHLDLLLNTWNSFSSAFPFIILFRHFSIVLQHKVTDHNLRIERRLKMKLGIKEGVYILKSWGMLKGLKTGKTRHFSKGLLTSPKVDSNCSEQLLAKLGVQSLKLLNVFFFFCKS